jgi:hypothetical protein
MKGIISLGKSLLSESKSGPTVRTCSTTPDVLLSPEWSALSKEQLERGLGIPRQAESWSCGPNSLARTFAMLPTPHLPDYTQLVAKCPTTLPLVGPMPHMLCRYARGRTEDNDVNCVELDPDQEHWQEALGVIRAEISDKRAVIALIAYHVTALHYLNVVGFSDAQQQLALMDTNAAIYTVSYDHFGELMLAVSKYTYLGVLPPRLYLIRVHPLPQHSSSDVVLAS